jgi:hypothetical protein
VNLFDEWRYLDHGEVGMDNSKRPLNTDFILNKAEYQGGVFRYFLREFGVRLLVNILFLIKQLSATVFIFLL